MNWKGRGIRRWKKRTSIRPRFQKTATSRSYVVNNDRRFPSEFIQDLINLKHIHHSQRWQLVNCLKRIIVLSEGAHKQICGIWKMGNPLKIHGKRILKEVQRLEIPSQSIMRGIERRWYISCWYLLKEIGLRKSGSIEKMLYVTHRRSEVHWPNFTISSPVIYFYEVILNICH